MQVAVADVEVDLAVANAPTAEILSLVSHSHLVVETEMIIDSFSDLSIHLCLPLFIQVFISHVVDTMNSFTLLCIYSLIDLFMVYISRDNFSSAEIFLPPWVRFC